MYFFTISRLFWENSSGPTVFFRGNGNKSARTYVVKRKKVRNGPSTAFFFFNMAYMVLSVVMTFIFFQWQMLRINHGFCTQNLKQLS